MFELELVVHVLEADRADRDAIVVAQLEVVVGVRVVAQGRRPDIQHRVEAQISPSGRRFMWVKGGSQTVESGPGTDVTANLRGYISVTPMRADLTAHDQLDVLGAALQ